ncbi:MAG: acetyl-CoA acetyltransferase [Acidimicrobiales bacterium]|jgi:acetyl-CoA C-acetyltransferase
MTGTVIDPERVPVVVASGQSIERSELVTPLDLMARACEAALDDVPALRAAVDRLSVVNVLGRTASGPARELAHRIGAAGASTEVTTIGGNSPQWLVNRAATDIAEGRLGVTIIAGAEAIRSSRARRAAGLPREDGPAEGPPDPVVGDDLPGLGPAESAIGLALPVHVYPLFESVVASRAGHDAAAHRQSMGRLLAPLSATAATNPFAWFPTSHDPDTIATPSTDNRIVCEPYTKLMTAFLGSDQGAALVVCSLDAARRAGVADRAVFVWSGAEAVDVRFPASRPDPGRSPAIAAAGDALFHAASTASSGGSAGGSGSAGAVGIDDIELLDLYSCFPSAIELAAEALGITADDGRGLSVTGGLPYFGGPGNNYTTHAIATMTDLLRGAPTRLGMTTGVGWFITKHALGIYGSTPPPGGFRRGDTVGAQGRIDASAVETALGVDEPTEVTIVAATVVRDHQGQATGAPLIARLPDGRHMALAAADGDVIRAVGDLDVPGLVGGHVVVRPGPARYRLATG